MEERGVVIEVDPAVALEGDLTVPERRGGVVLFANGSGSGRHSPRNRRVAATLQEAGFATLLRHLGRARSAAGRP